jgi:predicted NUDIX family NTP pyrophosphohydrolase
MQRTPASRRAPARSAKVSAGILLYRLPARGPEVFLVHPGGPFWAKRDLAAWSVPKGEIDADEDPLEAAKREFFEETGQRVDGNFVELSPVRQPGGKVVCAWAVEGEIDAAAIVSNTFSIEWPPKSGKTRAFPEIDRAGWFALDDAREKILAGQQPLLDQLMETIAK